MNSRAGAIPSACAQLLIVATVWVSLYLVNDWLFQFVAVSQYISWVFLPAAVRMLAVLLAGWTGVAGLFLGSLVTGLYGFYGASLGQVVVLAGLSAFAPMLAFIVCAHLLGLRADLQGLSAMQLVVLSFVCALFTAGLHSVHLYAFGAVEAFFEAFIPMFVGDLVGTIAVLYLAKILMGLMGPTKPAAT